ncbi:Astacin-like metalloprotease toxin, partial [Leptotrombidium deliense]
CYSYVGVIKNGAQSISLGDGCHSFGTILHEIMHAIGFYHAHSRIDRDEFLNIYWNNIKDKFKSQFRKLDAYSGKIYTPFDYDSIMLYGSRAFSRDGSITMSPKKPGVVLKDSYRKKSLSKYDIEIFE